VFNSTLNVDITRDWKRSSIKCKRNELTASLKSRFSYIYGRLWRVEINCINARDPIVKSKKATQSRIRSVNQGIGAGSGSPGASGWCGTFVYIVYSNESLNAYVFKMFEGFTLLITFQI
jgi:hypothetical protein